MSTDPTYNQNLLAQAQQLHRAGNLLAALGLYQQLAKRLPNNAQMVGLVGATQRGLGRLSDAKQSLTRAIRLAPREAWLHHEMALVHKLKGDFPKAHRSLDEARRLRPEIPTYQAAKAELHFMAGEFEAAAELLEPALKLQPINVSVALLFGKLCGRLDRRDEGIAMLEQCRALPGMPARERTNVLFTLADLLHETKQFDRAFETYRHANESRAAQFHPDDHSAAIDRVLGVWTPEAVTSLPQGDPKTELPVFIVGMPRSGTSLVEQILASHPQVFGAGELIQIPRYTRELQLHQTPIPVPDTLETLKEKELVRRAREYLHDLRSLSPTAARITDKLPTNFLSLGLIGQLFPKARVIHCIRDPVDTCLSCYFHMFFGSLAFAYDLTHLGRFYRDYERLMQHWHATLAIPILDVHYENLVDNQEAVSRQMIDFIGLPWDDACLKFHENKRITLTSSNAQVRQAIYRSAIGRHQPYEAYLGPLRAALGQRPSPLAPAPAG